VFFAGIWDDIHKTHYFLAKVLSEVPYFKLLNLVTVPLHVTVVSNEVNWVWVMNSHQPLAISHQQSAIRYQSFCNAYVLMADSRQPTANTLTVNYCDKDS
jgi:hypothetical protein